MTIGKDNTVPLTTEAEVLSKCRHELFAKSI